MILILSEDGDKTTDLIVDWLNYYKSEHLILKTRNFYSNIPVCINISDNFSLNELFKNVNIAWCRRWDINIDEDFNISIKKNIINELRIFSNTFFSSLKNVSWLNHPFNTKIEKTTQLKLAKENGLNIPETIITNNKKNLLEFIEKFKNVISKPISSSIEIFHNDDLYVSYTNRVSVMFAESLPTFFAPSLFQVELKKDFEIRAFYLDGKLYSMAIFSQLDSKTSLDHKKYNMTKPNRRIPYIIPNNIEKSIIKFMKKANLQIGVLDLVKTIDDKIYFLEVNPVGQFNDISINCNYNLEKKVAEYLICKNEEAKINKFN